MTEPFPTLPALAIPWLLFTFRLPDPDQLPTTPENSHGKDIQGNKQKYHMFTGKTLLRTTSLLLKTTITIKKSSLHLLQIFFKTSLLVRSSVHH